MAKKVILYPIIKDTTYHPTDNPYCIKRGVAGKPDEVKGSLVSYQGAVGSNIEYVENKVFDETLTYQGYGRGRSSSVFYWTDATGAKYQMFMSDMNDLLFHKEVTNKQVTGTWTYCKKGQNFGIKLALANSSTNKRKQHDN